MKTMKETLLQKAKERLRLFSLNLHDPALSSEFPLRIAEWQYSNMKIDHDANVAIFEFRAILALDRSTMHPGYEWVPLRRPANDDLIIMQVVKIPLGANETAPRPAIESLPELTCV